MTAVVQAVKPALKVPFGVNYLWDPMASVAIGRRPAPASCARSSPACSPPTWAVAARLRRRGAARRNLGSRRHEASLQHQCRVRPFARPAPHRAARQERGVLLARRCHPGVGSADRRSRPTSPHLRKVADTVKDVPVFANTGVNIDNVSGRALDRRRRRHRHPFQGRRQSPGTPSMAVASSASWTRCGPALTEPLMTYVIGLDIGTTSTIGILIGLPDRRCCVSRRAR